MMRRQSAILSELRLRAPMFSPLQDPGHEERDYSCASNYFQHRDFCIHRSTCSHEVVRQRLSLNTGGATGSFPSGKLFKADEIDGEAGCSGTGHSASRSLFPRSATTGAQLARVGVRDEIKEGERMAMILLINDDEQVRMLFSAWSVANMPVMA